MRLDTIMSELSRVPYIGRSLSLYLWHSTRLRLRVPARKGERLVVSRVGVLQSIYRGIGCVSTKEEYRLPIVILCSTDDVTLTYLI